METLFGLKGLLCLVNVREEKSGKPLRLTLPLLASVHQRTCVWGCGSVWSHCGLLPCVSLTALVSSNPGWDEAAWGQMLSQQGSEVSTRRVMPELQLNWEWLISSFEGLRGLATFPVKYLLDCDIAQRGTEASWQIISVITTQCENDPFGVSQQQRFIGTDLQRHDDSGDFKTFMQFSNLNDLFFLKNCLKGIANTMSVQHSWKYFENRQEAYFPFSCYVSHKLSDPWEFTVPTPFLWPSLIFFPLLTVDQSLNSLHGLFHITQARALSAEAPWPCKGWQEGGRFHTCCHCRASVLSRFLAFSSWSHIRDNRVCVNNKDCVSIGLNSCIIDIVRLEY